jgi:hypothetical protein
MSMNGAGIGAAAKRQQLHEQAAIGTLGLPVLEAAFLADIRRLDARPSCRPRRRI